MEKSKRCWFVIGKRINSRFYQIHGKVPQMRTHDKSYTNWL